MKERQYDAGAVIFIEDEIGETAYVIKQGRVEVLKRLNGKDVHIAYIGSGEPFGEMSMIDEKPRSATIVAVEKTIVLELHRDEFLPSLQSRPEIAISLLKILFERLREADAQILQLHRSRPESLLLAQNQSAPAWAASETVISLEGLTVPATRALPTEPFQIDRFPFRVGRRCSDPLVKNDLSLLDSSPWQVSRHHLAFVKQEGRIGISDRGSRLGSWIDGKKLGGDRGYNGTVFLGGHESTLVLGELASPFRFKVTIQEHATL